MPKLRWEWRVGLKKKGLRYLASREKPPISIRGGGCTIGRSKRVLPRKRPHSIH